MTAGIDGRQKHRLCVYDRDNKIHFLVDTGADISVLAAKDQKRREVNNSHVLYAANSSKIKTYGEKCLVLNLGLQNKLRWTFTIADVSTSILGADFLARNNILVDLRRKKTH